MPVLVAPGPLAAETVDRWAIFVFATMAYDSCHARMHAMVESSARLGFDAVYVEAPNSKSRHHPDRGAPSLNRGGWRLRPPEAPVPTPDGSGVLCVPKKLRLGPVRVALDRRRQECLYGAWLERFFAHYRERTGKRILAIVSSARWQPALDRIPFDLVVFDKLDPPEVLKGWLDVGEYLKREDRLVERSAFVTTITSSLEEAVRIRHPGVEIRRVPNGVDCAFFDANRNAPVPELIGAPRPVAGFLGTVAGWVDVELLAACAREYPGWTFPVFGPVGRGVDLSPLRDLPNVSLQGRVAYERVPAIMQAFDVGLMPFRPGVMSDYANPVTLYEFLALGKPVVCTPLVDIEGLEGLIFACGNEFVPNVKRASQACGERLARRRRAVAESHSWDALVHGILSSLPL